MPKLTLGSLFSGIGGFELAAQMYGIEPVWASEIEEAPIRITKRHFPNMNHIGDITKIDGGKIDPVDIISGGSPCFPAGTMILTDKGYINIEEIKVGDVVLTHKGRWRSVTAIGHREAETIILEGSRTLETTHNHPIYSMVDGICTWIPAEDMLGKYWASPRHIDMLELKYPLIHSTPQSKCETLLNALLTELEGHSCAILKDGDYYTCTTPQDSDTIYRNGLHTWYKVTSITPTNQVKTVYNISVEEDESYVADSIVVHNCQDISCAGKQAGISRICQDCGFSISANSDVFTCPECGSELELTRSGLFMEQIRIIKEMREATNGEYPKFIIWENVGAALSSNNGNDFYCVLREFAGLFGEELPTFRPKQWTKAGELLGKSGSLAWRTLDAQYWGVPQRRRRIFLVTDLGGQRAREVLFKPESLRRHTPQGEIPWKRASGKAESSVGKASTSDVAETTTYGFEPGASSRLKGSRLWPELSGTLRAQMGDNQMSVLVDSQSEASEVYGICSMGLNSMKSSNPNSGFYKADVAKTLDTTGTDHTCNQGGNVVVQEPVYCIQGNCVDRADTASCNGKGWKEDVSYTLTTIDRPAVAYSIKDQTEKSSAAFAYQAGPGVSCLPYNEELSPTLVASQKMGVLIENHPADSRVKISDDGICQTLSARMGTGGGNVPLVMEQPALCATTGHFMGCDEEVVPTLLARDYKDPKIVYKSNSIVRRLTPVECERLQGFTDNWTYPESDAARYKALGNSVAVPCVAYIMSGIADVLDPIE